MDSVLDISFLHVHCRKIHMDLIDTIKRILLSLKYYSETPCIFIIPKTS